MAESESSGAWWKFPPLRNAMLLMTVAVAVVVHELADLVAAANGARAGRISSLDKPRASLQERRPVSALEGFV